PVADRNCRRVSEDPPGPADIRERVPHVSCAERTVAWDDLLCRQAQPGDLGADQQEQLVERGARSVPDVEDLAEGGGAGGGGGEQVRLDDVVHEAKVAAGLAVAVDGDVTA